MKTNIDNLRVYSTVVGIANSDGELVKGTEREVVLLYNCTQITTKEIDKAFKNDTWEFDERLIQVTRKQLEYLHDKDTFEPKKCPSEFEEIEENFYQGYKG